MIERDIIDAMAYSLTSLPNPIIIVNNKVNEIKKNGRVIFQGNNTILKVKDKVYIARPEKGDKFDAEKGLLICLVKALGLTTSDVLDLYGRAEVKKSKAKANSIKQDKMKIKK